MKPIATALSLSAFILTACTANSPRMSVGLGLGTGIGSHIGLGTSVNIPVGIDKRENRIPKNNGGIHIIEEQIVTYFDAQGNPADSPVKGGYYRQLISRHNHEYLVQDFYSDNSRKRTDPYPLPRERLLQFRATPYDGSLTVYAYNGNVMQQQVFKNGKLISTKY